MSRTRPIFAGRVEPIFVLPCSQIAFLEPPAGPSATAPAEPVRAVRPAGPEPDLELDGDFMRRVRDL